MRSKRLLLAAIMIAAALSLACSSRSWVTLTFAADAAAFAWLDLNGNQLSPALTPLPLAVLASALALTIAGRVTRVLLGALVALLGAGIALLACAAYLDPVRGSSRGIAEATGIVGDTQQLIITGSTVTAWPLVTAGIGVLLLLLGCAVLVVGGRWSARTEKYERSNPQREQRDQRDQPRARSSTLADDRVAAWDALNRGNDPSVNP